MFYASQVWFLVLLAGSKEFFVKCVGTCVTDFSLIWCGLEFILMPCFMSRCSAGTAD